MGRASDHSAGLTAMEGRWKGLGRKSLRSAQFSEHSSQLDLGGGHHPQMVGQGHTVDPACCVVAWGQPEEGMAPPYPRQHTEAWICAYVGSSSLWFPGSLPPPLGRLRRELMRLAARQYCYRGSWGTHSSPKPAQYPV